MKRKFTMKYRIGLCIVFALVCVGLCSIFASCENSGGGSDYGGTNVQEVGVDEGDIAKYVGEYLYVLQPDGITVSRTLPNGELRLISAYKQTEATPCEMYVSDNRLIAIYTYVRQDGNMDCVWSGLRIFDLTGLGEEFSFENSQIYALDVKGAHLDSRIVIERERMLICYGLQDQEVIDAGKMDKEGNLIVEYRETTLDYEVNGEEKRIAETEPLKNIPEGMVSHDVTVYATIDLSENKFDLKMKATSGFPFQTLYVSEYGFYTVYSYEELRTEKGGCGRRVSRITHSMICKTDGETLETVGQKFFLGMELISRHAVKDTGENVYFAMLDTEYRNVVLLATDKNLNLVGYLSDICQEEEIKSVSYTEDGGRLYCFIVTYKQIINLDPLFKIDVTDPEEMKVTGLLSIDGFSSYTINFDGGYTVGIGEDGQGGVKVSLFDTKNDIPMEINSFIKSDAYSEANDDSHAFCVDKSRKLFAIPIIENAGGKQITTRMYFYRITEEGDLEELGFVENQDCSDYLRRAFFAEEFVYVVSGANIKSLSVSEALEGNFEPVYELSTAIQ